MKGGESVGGWGGEDEGLGFRVLEVSLVLAHSVTPTTQNKPFFNTEPQLTAEGRGSRHAGERIRILRKTKTHDVIPCGTVVELNQ